MAPAKTEALDLSILRVMQVQVACDACGAELVLNSAYCERCGTRTRRARRLVRLAIRVELLFLLLVVGVIVAFAWIYSVQK
jgi:predicted amidophosphoribosyltransferase